MRGHALVVALLCALLSLLNVVDAAKKPANAILLSDVETLTFRKDKKTTHRRVPAVPQLKAVGGAAANLYTPDLIRCRNAGASYGAEDIEWTCTASLPPEFKLGSTDVVCEGYDSKSDPYVLKGSCGVEYRLLLTEQGEARYGRSGGRGRSGEGNMVSAMFWLLFVGVAVWMAYSAFTNYRARATGQRGQGRRPGRNGFGGFFGGGGGDDGNDPPPPYSPRPPPRKPAPEASTYWRPGFWSGAATGAAAGYAAGNWGRNDRRRGYGDYYDGYGGGYGGGSWFGGGAGPSRPRRYGGESPSGPSYSSSRHESTGFGGTSRR